MVVVSEDPKRTTVRVLTKWRSAVNATAKEDYSNSILPYVESKPATTAAANFRKASRDPLSTPNPFLGAEHLADIATPREAELPPGLRTGL